MKVLLSAIGYIGRDCSVKHHENGNTAITFPLATTERWKDAQGVKNETTLWIDCTVWRKADKIGIAEYLKKGALIECSGRPSARGFKAKQSDEIKASLAMRVDDLTLLATPKEKPAENNLTASTGTTQEDDLPF